VRLADASGEHNIINFAHGAWLLAGLILGPMIAGALGIAIKRLLLRHVYGLDHL